MKPGEIAEFAIWLNGQETEEQMQHFRSTIIPKMVENTQKEHSNKIMLRNMREYIKRPGEDRVPKVPKNIQGIDVRLWIIEHDVFPGPAYIEHKASITHDLDNKSLQTLRRITRREHAKAHPGMPALSNKQCDAIIDALGTEMIAQMLRGQSAHH